VTDGPDFEIVAGPEHSAEEDLPEPRPRGSSRVRAVAAVLVAAAVVALVAFRIASTHHSVPTAAGHRRPTPGASATVGGQRRPHHDVPSSPPTRPPAPYLSCPGGASPGDKCLITHHVSRSVEAAIRARFPRAHHFRELDVALRSDLADAPLLYYREIHARVNHVQISITVSRRKLTLPEEVAASANILSYSYYARDGLHITSVGVALGYRWRLLPAARMFSLTSDPRLRAFGPS
jgi:hypothetical protein